MGNELRKPINAVNEVLNRGRHDRPTSSRPANYETANASTSMTPTLETRVEPHASYVTVSGTATATVSKQVGPFLVMTPLHIQFFLFWNKLNYKIYTYFSSHYRTMRRLIKIINNLCLHFMDEVNFF